MEVREFCTCPDHSCPFNPVNNDRGCDLCILKCLNKNEIPSCFFNKISSERPENDDYTFNGFAKYVEIYFKKNH